MLNLKTKYLAHLSRYILFKRCPYMIKKPEDLPRSLTSSFIVVQSVRNMSVQRHTSARYGEGFMVNKVSDNVETIPRFAQTK